VIAPGALLGAGKEAEVLAYGDAAIKLYRRPEAKLSAFREAAILAQIEPLGLPVPRLGGVVAIGERWGVVMDRVSGPPLAEALLAAGPDAVASGIERMVDLQRRTHAAPGLGLVRLRDRLAGKLATAPDLEAADRARLLRRLDELPDGDRLCHGDFHPFNLMGDPDALTIVDWPDATSGPPAADACRSYLLMRIAAPVLAEAYLSVYAKAAGMARDPILAWLPILAAARLSEGVPEETPALLALAGA
jgi:aminoglycoside phosphotransferase (APT) family kinase protein